MEREVELNGTIYGVGKLSVIKQLHISRRLAPMLSSMLQAMIVAPDSGSLDELLLQLVATPAIMKTIASMTDEDAEYVCLECLKVCQRKQENGWARVADMHGHIMFDDIGLDTMLALTASVVQENLGSFFPTGQRPSTETK